MCDYTYDVMTVYTVLNTYFLVFLFGHFKCEKSEQLPQIECEVTRPLSYSARIAQEKMIEREISKRFLNNFFSIYLKYEILIGT